MGTKSKIVSQTFGRFLKTPSGKEVEVGCRGTVRASGLLLWSRVARSDSPKWQPDERHRSEIGHQYARRLDHALSGRDPGHYDNSEFVRVSLRLRGRVLFGDGYPNTKAVYDSDGKRVHFKAVSPLAFSRWCAPANIPLTYKQQIRARRQRHG